jgi:hypothetical protein
MKKHPKVFDSLFVNLVAAGIRRQDESPLEDSSRALGYCGNPPGD